MNMRRIAALTAAGAVIAGGAGVAVGATSGKQAEQQVLADAAKRLEVTPQRLREALAAAQDAQLDRAVKAGELTQEQAARIKAQRAARGTVLGGGPGGRGHHGGFRGGPGGRGAGMMADVAKALGLTQAELREQLHAGKSIADVAKAQGKSLDSVKRTVRAAARTRLDKAVQDGDLTRAQADDMLAQLEEHIARFDQAGPGRHRRAHRP